MPINETMAFSLYREWHCCLVSMWEEANAVYSLNNSVTCLSWIWKTWVCLASEWATPIRILFSWWYLAPTGHYRTGCPCGLVSRRSCFTMVPSAVVTNRVGSTRTSWYHPEGDKSLIWWWYPTQQEQHLAERVSTLTLEAVWKTIKQSSPSVFLAKTCKKKITCRCWINDAFWIPLIWNLFLTEVLWRMTEGHLFWVLALIIKRQAVFNGEARCCFLCNGNQGS